MIQTFSGTIGIGDMQRHIPHRFDVPEGTTRLEIRFDFTPRHPGMRSASAYLTRTPAAAPSIIPTIRPSS